ncbi:MAG: hypothetical protein M3R38_02485 [Actinomycetota bacterium]|nr:hypothetical protein [Actinomycetota bacterium]
MAIAAETPFGAAFGPPGILLSLPVAVVAGVVVRELWLGHLEAQEEPESEGPCNRR